MGDIKAFLQPPIMGETKEIVVSKRFRDDKGNTAPFVVRVIDQETNDRIVSRATTKKKVNGTIVQEFDSTRYGKLLVQACVVEPDFSNAELCAYYKTADPLDVPGRMLSVGEYNRLVSAIKEINEISTSEEELDGLEDEAKN